MAALKEKTAGAVFAATATAVLPKGVSEFSKKMLSIKTSPSGKYFERPMYCETSFDLGVANDLRPGSRTGWKKWRDWLAGLEWIRNIREPTERRIAVRSRSLTTW